MSEVKKISYFKKLQHPKWQQKRMQVLTRDNFTCLICKSKEDMLEVHHEVYGKEPWDIDIKHLKTLCFRCHDVVELCKNKGVFYKNFNRLKFTEEKFIYIVNTKIDNQKREGKFAWVIHNFNEKHAFVLVPFCFPKSLIEYINNTF